MHLIETKDSRAGQESWEGSSCKLTYRVQLEAGENETTLRLAMLAITPETLDPEAGSPTGYILYRGPIRTKPVEAQIFDTEVEYFQAKPTQFSFSTGGGTAKTTYSRRTERSYDVFGKQDAPSPNFQQGINVTKNAVEGVDIPISQPAFKVTKSYSLAEIDGTYLDLLEDYTGKINDDAFSFFANGIERNYEALELKLADTNGQTTENGRFEITYSFEVSRGIYPNRQDTWRYIGEPNGLNTIVIKDKAGWDFLWVHDEESHADGYFVRVPKTAYIENVIQARDFSELLL